MSIYQSKNGVVSTMTTSALEDFAINTLRQRNKLQSDLNHVLSLLHYYQADPSTLRAEFVVKTLTDKLLQHKS
jgi:hypothetical protein